MKAKILLDPNKPKVDYDKVRGVVLAAGIELSTRRADIGIVVGGDGVFSEFGRSESIPLLFVGVKSRRPTGSKAYLAEVEFEEIGATLARVAAGKYSVVQFKRLEVLKDGRSLGDVFTDVYLQRGADSNCVRYHLTVKGMSEVTSESAIGDGVVVSTSAGSTGYFSYPDKLKNGDHLVADGHTYIGEDQVGICHILPTYTQREGSNEHPLRYTVPWGCRIEMKIDRPVDARLFGLGWDRQGVKVTTKDLISVVPSQRTTRVIRTTGNGVASRPNHP